jgi:chromosome segregation protein
MLKFPNKFSIIVNPKNVSSQIEKKTNEYNNKEKLFNKYKTIQTEKLNKIDQEINDKTEKINALILKIYELDVNTKKELNLRNKYEYEQIKITNYCNDLKSKHSNIKKTKDDYENKIDLLKFQNEKLQNDFDEQLNILAKENKNLSNELEDKINIYNNNKTEIIFYQNKIKDTLNEIEQQRINFKEKENVNNIKFNELENKYLNLQNKIYNLQMNSGIRKTELIKNRKIQKNVSNEKQQLENELKQIQKNNQDLEKQIQNMNKFYKNLINNNNNSNKKK